MFKSVKDKESFTLLSLTLAGKIGVGSISGIALAIKIGGIGTIFWLWVSSIFLIPIAYFETKLGLKYKKEIDKTYIGGPQVYIEQKLNKKKLAIIYSLLIILIYIVSFISIQTNTIITSFSYYFNNKVFLMIILVLITYFSINKGINSITKITNFLVPIMSILYMIIGVIIIIKNNNLIYLIKVIIQEAFNIKNIKQSLILPIVIGFERAIFSNETAIGTTTMLASISNDNNLERQSSIQIISILFTNLIICTITAFIILSTTNSIFPTSNGIEMIYYSINKQLGNVGTIILTMIIFLFAFSTIITSYYYGEINIKYLINKNSTIAKIIVIIVVIFSSFIDGKIIWKYIDLIIAIATLINIYAIKKVNVYDRK